MHFFKYHGLTSAKGIRVSTITNMAIMEADAPIMMASRRLK